MFRCSDPRARPPVCELFGELAYATSVEEHAGVTVCWLEDQRMHFGEHPG